jgi:hypothetical protein
MASVFTNICVEKNGVKAENSYAFSHIFHSILRLEEYEFQIFNLIPI